MACSLDDPLRGLQIPNLMSKKTPVTVTISETRHKKQPFTVTIDKPGKAEPYVLKQRYSRKDAAERGALRNLEAIKCGDNVWKVLVGNRKGNHWAPIKFVFIAAYSKKRFGKSFADIKKP